MAEASLRGDGLSLVLRLSGYAHSELANGMDANFISGEIDVVVGMSAPFQVRMPVTVHTEDLRRFSEQLRRLDDTLSGEAVLNNVDSDFYVVVKLASGKGTASGIVREWATALSFKQVPIDQTYIRAALHDFDKLVSAFPVRGRPTG